MSRGWEFWDESERDPTAPLGSDKNPYPLDPNAKPKPPSLLREAFDWIFYGIFLVIVVGVPALAGLVWIFMWGS